MMMITHQFSNRKHPQVQKIIRSNHTCSGKKAFKDLLLIIINFYWAKKANARYPRQAPLDKKK